jgi:hypothetical protein
MFHADFYSMLARERQKEIREQLRLSSLLRMRRPSRTRESKNLVTVDRSVSTHLEPAVK